MVSLRWGPPCGDRLIFRDGTGASAGVCTDTKDGAMSQITVISGPEPGVERRTEAAAGHLEEPLDYGLMDAGGGAGGRVVPIPMHRSAGRLEKRWPLRGRFDSLRRRCGGGRNGRTAGFL